MDSSPEAAGETKSLPFAMLRCFLVFLLPTIFLFSLPLLMGFLLFLFANLSITNPIALPSQCKIVSTSVDIRSSKLCELGLLNYRAKHVSYPFDRSKFRCRYDYYWTSVFKVEHTDLLSGQTRVAFAEAPKEPLPLYCRPNFGAVWLTQYKFKVNETYDCWHTSDISRVTLYRSDLFSCQATEPSVTEKIGKYCAMLMEIIEFWLSSQGRAQFLRWETIAGVFAGFSTSLISITCLRLLQLLLSSSCRMCMMWVFPLALTTLRIRRACLFVAYLSFVSWLAVQYGKKLGLLDVFWRP